MRILHLHAADLSDPLSREIGLRTHEIGRRLAQHHQVTVVSPAGDAGPGETVREGVRYLRLGAPRAGRPGFVFALQRCLHRAGADLLVEESLPGTGAWGAWLKPRGLPLVASVQRFGAPATGTHRWLSRWRAGVERVRWYSHCVLTSPSMQARIEALHPPAVCRVVPDGVDEGLFRTPAQLGRGILYLGPVELSSHGVDLLLQAYGRVPPALREPLTLAGPVHDAGALKALLQQTGLAGQVQVAGDGDARRRAQWLEQCRFVAMPARHDGGTRAIVEANAAAKPVLLWDQAPMNEVASRACLRVAAFDVRAYAQAMTDLLQASRDEMQLRALHARAHARRYNWDHAADAQEQFYLECLAAQTPTRSHRSARHAPH